VRRALLFRPAARRDLLRLVDALVARGAFTAAHNLAAELDTQTARLAQTPFIGAQGQYATLRQWVFHFGRSRYVIRYSVTDDAVIIIRIWHGKENRPPR
jgi:plasmid stabilization system protein ParE